MVDDFLKSCFTPKLKPYVDNRLVAHIMWAYHKSVYKEKYKPFISEVLESHDIWMHYYVC